MTLARPNPQPQPDADHGPRQRILDAADDLFYRQGVHATGIDRIIERAKVAKASFYDHFKSKDDLIAQYAKERGRRWDAWFAARMRQAPQGGAARLRHVLDVLQEFIRSPEFEGCAFVALSQELSAASHPARKAALAMKQGTRDGLAALAQEAGVNEPDQVGAALAALIDGVLVAARMSAPSGVVALQGARLALDAMISASGPAR